jgi:putative thioredoxin
MNRPMEFANTPAKAASAAIIDVTAASFAQDVIERSKTVPVLVDLWATWCGPCKTLGPVLEKLAREWAGKFVLAKVDIDANPEVADVFNVQSVPTVMLLKGGKIVDGFVGAQAEDKIREVLARHVEPPVDPLEQALEAEKRGDTAAALATLSKLAAGKHSMARAHLARLLLASGDEERGRAAYDALSSQEKELDPARAAQALIALRNERQDLGPLEAAVKRDPEDVAARLAYGKALLAEGRNEAGLEEIYQAAKRDVRFGDGAPRKALLAAFEVLGATNPLTLEYRRRLSILLCS